MTALELFVNDASLGELDTLIKMAIIHHQFESIHPFPDGNGRIGKILNMLYLVAPGLLDQYFHQLHLDSGTSLIELMGIRVFAFVV